MTSQEDNKSVSILTKSLNALINDKSNDNKSQLTEPVIKVLEKVMQNTLSQFTLDLSWK